MKTNPDFEKRPWGSYEVLSRSKLVSAVGASSDIVIKKITIESGKRVSYQSHNGRAEHWYVVSGSGVAVVDGVGREVREGDSVDVPLKTKHRIGSSGKESLVFIEIATGTVDEGDIIRYEDDFGRVNQ